jgi:hypothetical protein
MGGRFWSPSYFAGPCGGAPLHIVKDDIADQKRPEYAGLPPRPEGQGFRPPITDDRGLGLGARRVAQCAVITLDPPGAGNTVSP